MNTEPATSAVVPASGGNFPPTPAAGQTLTDAQKSAFVFGRYMDAMFALDKLADATMLDSLTYQQCRDLWNMVVSLTGHYGPYAEHIAKMKEAA